MKKSGYLAKRSAAEKETLAVMQEIMEQFLFDTAVITLHEDFGWGYERLKRFEQKWSETHDHFIAALEGGMESDVYQERLDRPLRAIVGDRQEFHDFHDRYPMIKQLGYGPRGGRK